MAIESPKYAVISKSPVYEIRQYEPYILAQVEVDSGFDDAVNLGFSPLAGYIFGDNKSRSHIAMTVPVTEESAAASQKIPMTRPVTAAASGPGRYTISFTMPKKYSLETLPEPNNRAISFRALPAHKAAVIKFPGRMNAKLFERKEKELRGSLESDGFAAKSAAVAAQYDPPWIPGFLRKNEVLIDI